MLTKKPYSKVGILFTFQPPQPTVHLVDPVSLYKIFSTSTHITLYNTGYNSIQPPASTQPTSSARVAMNETELTIPYPNPFYESLTIPIGSTKEGQLYEVQILSVDGKFVWGAKGSSSDTSTNVYWNGKSSDGSNVAPGMYLSRIILEGKEIVTHKIILAK